MKKIKKAIALMLAILLIAAVPSSASSINTIGTSAALGSPILNPSSFNRKNWDDKGKWETIVFGIFTGNFVKPLVDDYESAFDTSSSDGSKGDAIRALQFGAGGDVESNKALMEMLRYTINLSKNENYMKEITVKKYEVGVHGATETTGSYPATLKDMFIMSYVMTDGGQGGNERVPTNKDKQDMQAYQGGSLTGDWLTSLKEGFSIAASVINGDSSASATSINTGILGLDEGIVWEPGSLHSNRTTTHTIVTGMLPKFYTNYIPDAPGSEQLVLDYMSGWDIQMLSAWLSNTFSIDSPHKVSETRLKELLEKRLYMDGIGNIVVRDGSRHIMVFPAASNQHITKSAQYNMLQSVVFGGNYINTTTEELIQKAAAGNYDWENPIDNSGLGDGKTVLLFDSNSHLIPLAKNDETARENSLGRNKTLVIPEESKILFGSIFSDIVKAKLSDGRNPFILATVGATSGSNYTIVNGTARGASAISQAFPVDSNVPVLSSIDIKGSEFSIFGDEVIISTWEHEPERRTVSIAGDDSYRDREPNSQSLLRHYPNYILNKYELNDPEALNSLENIKTAKTVEDTAHRLITNALDLQSPVNALFKGLLQWAGHSQLNYAVLPTDFSEQSAYYFENLSSSGIKNADGSAVNVGYTNAFKRIAKVFLGSNTFRSVSAVMGLTAGSKQEFAAYTPYIYMTYLDWYGIIGGGELKLNKDMYNEDIVNTFDIDKATIGSYMSEDEKKEKILEYTYMILDPVAGQEYRANMMMDNFNGWAQKTYQSIVYGGDIEIDSTSTLSNRYSTGFLKVENYSDNFTTKWFMDKYTDIIVVIIGVMIVAMLIAGIVLRKKIAWFVATTLLVINITLLLPAIGEVTPYLANSMVQNLFSDKMSYWSISEGVANATIEKRAMQQDKSSVEYAIASQVDSSEAGLITGLVRSLNMNYSDRAVMLRLDISKKVTESQLYDFAEIQSLESARWLLPTMIRQFSANNNSKDYVYVPLADVYDNLSNLYWTLNPNDYIVNSDSSHIGTGQSTPQEIVMDKYDILRYYEGYSDISNNPISQANLVANQRYKSNLANETWQSISRGGIKEREIKHTFSHLLRLSRAIPGKSNTESIEEYLENKSSIVQSSLKSVANDIEIYAGTYNMSEISSVQADTFGFLWATENPMHYFYQTAKDTFPPDMNLAELAGELQGEFIPNADTGEEVRSSFMYFADSNNIRDFLDMEELFTNVIPYLYKVQVLAGGLDGKSGIFGGELIENYELYKSNKKSWLFRSNWVTKIIENSKYNSPSTAIDQSGNEIVIDEPLNPASYPVERPMVFSAAQMEAQGLNESKLTLPELKILKINEAVEKKWTLMLNYVNVPGMTKEVIVRQMALEALLEFNKEFSTSAPLNSSLTMYPNGLDLRNLSFDSVMKMLMINTTKDTRFIYGDTMTRVIENTDLFSTILLLAGAFVCSYLIPFVRNIVLGLLFYIGLWALATNIISSGKSKIKITTAFVINNLLFLALNFGFYLVFSSMISLTYSDNVLTAQNISVSVGNPIWVFIIVLMAGLAYIKGALSIINVCIKNSRDMGYEMYATWSGMVVDKISSGVKSAQSIVAGTNVQNLTNTPVRAVGDAINTGNKLIDTEHRDTDRDKKKTNSRKQIEQGYDSGHVVGSEISTETDESEIIKREIQKGRKITNGQL